MPEVTLEQQQRDDLQRALDENGFIILATPVEHKVGDVIDNIIYKREAVDGAKAVVTGEATFEEWVRQNERYWPGESIGCYAVQDSWPYYYKVIAE